jgi:hypothetical protein
MLEMRSPNSLAEVGFKTPEIEDACNRLRRAGRQQYQAGRYPIKAASNLALNPRRDDDGVGLIGTTSRQLLVRRGFERLAGKSEDGAFYLTQAMGGGKIHSLIAFGLPAADPALRSDSRVSYALRGGGGT